MYIYFMQSPESLEKVIRLFIFKADQCVKDARAKNNVVIANVEDLDVGESPESLMLASTSHENAEDRRARALVVPALRFMWDAFRNVLETVRNNAIHEELYHSICKQAFAFCRDYERGNEFKRLCDILRIHLQNIYKTQQVPVDEKVGYFILT
jgi:translation initiation factor 3 subunit A